MELSWNQTGPQGPAGATGVTGPAGPRVRGAVYGGTERAERDRSADEWRRDVGGGMPSHGALPDIRRRLGGFRQPPDQCPGNGQRRQLRECLVHSERLGLGQHDRLRPLLAVGSQGGPEPSFGPPLVVTVDLTDASDCWL